MPETWREAKARLKAKTAARQPATIERKQETNPEGLLALLSDNQLATFIAAPGNRHESPLLLLALPQVSRIAKHVGLELNKTIVSLDAAYDSRANRKAIFNRGMVPNIPENPRGRRTQ
jgi:hypothetical protein